MIGAKHVKELLGERAKDIIMYGLNQTERNKKIKCPFHNDNNPSMSWFSDGLVWKCMSSCQETMDIYRYYQEFENMTFTEAVEKVAELVGERINEPVKKIERKKTFEKATENYGGLSEKAIEVAAKRGITKKTLEAWGVQAAKNRGSEWFVFRYKDEKGKIVFNTFRQLKEKRCEREKGTKEILWGINHVDVKKPVIIVEGQFDAMIVWQCGYKNVVSIPSGINSKGWIENSWNWLQTVESFIFWADSDEAGLKGAAEVRKRLGVEKVVVDYNAESKDPNDLYLNHGIEAVKDFIGNLLSVKTEGVNNMGRRRTDARDKERFYSGFPELDRHYKKFEFGHLTLLFGRDNEGKSTFLSQIIANVLKREKVFLYSGELTDDKIEQWIMSQIIGRKKGFVDVHYNEWNDKEFSIKETAKKAIRKWYMDRFYTYENKIELDGNGRMFKVMEQAYQRHGIRVFFLDNLMASNNSNDKDSNASETDFVKRCKKFAQTYRAHIFLVAHPNKIGSIDHTPLEKVHVAGSKNITNTADNIIGVERVWKVEDESLNEIYRQNDEQGKRFTGIIRCLKDRVATGRKDYFYKFDTNTFRFYNEKTIKDFDYGWEKFLEKKVTYNNGTTQTFKGGEMGNFEEIPL